MKKNWLSPDMTMAKIRPMTHERSVDTGMLASSVFATAERTSGYGESSSNARTMSGTVDFFSSLGTEKKKKPPPDRPDPSKVCF